MPLPIDGTSDRCFVSNSLLLLCRNGPPQPLVCRTGAFSQTATLEQNERKHSDFRVYCLSCCQAAARPAGADLHSRWVVVSCLFCDLRCLIDCGTASAFCYTPTGQNVTLFFDNFDPTYSANWANNTGKGLHQRQADGAGRARRCVRLCLQAREGTPSAKRVSSRVLIGKRLLRRDHGHRLWLQYRQRPLLYLNR